MSAKWQGLQAGTVLFAVVVLSSQAFGASCEWTDGGGDSLWATPGNWSCTSATPPPPPPGPEDVAIVRVNDGAHTISLESADHLTQISELQFDSARSTLTGSDSLAAKLLNVTAGTIGVVLADFDSNTPGSLTQSGGGTTVLTGANIYTGGTTIDSGILQINSPRALGSGEVTLNGGTLLSAFSDRLTNNFTLTAMGGTIAAQTDTKLVLSGALTLQPDSRLTFGSLGSTNGAGSIDLSVQPAMVGGSLQSLTIAAGTLTAVGGSLGQLTAVAETTTVDANLDLNGQSIAIKNLQGGPSGSVSPGANLGATLSLLTGNFAGSIDGAIQLHLLEGGTTVLTGTNRYSGGTVIESGGTLKISKPDALGSGDVTLNGGTLLSAFSDRLTNNFTLTAMGGTIAAQTDTKLVLSGALTLQPDSRLTFGSLGSTNGAGSIDLSVQPAMVGGSLQSLTIAAGTLTAVGGSLGQLTAVAETTTVDANLDLNGQSIAIKNLQGGPSGSVSPGANLSATLSLLTGNFAGSIDGAIQLHQLEGGTTVLTGTNRYSGGTVIESGGILQLGNGGETGSIRGEVFNNGALIFDRSNQLTHNGHISGSGTLTQAGTGSTILLGPTDYTGDTDVQQGVLQFEGDGTHVSAFTGNGTLAFGGGAMISTTARLSARPTCG